MLGYAPHIKDETYASGDATVELCLSDSNVFKGFTGDKPGVAQTRTVQARF